MLAIWTCQREIMKSFLYVERLNFLTLQKEKKKSYVGLPISMVRMNPPRDTVMKEKEICALFTVSPQAKLDHSAG